MSTRSSTWAIADAGVAGECHGARLAGATGAVEVAGDVVEDLPCAVDDEHFADGGVEGDRRCGQTLGNVDTHGGARRDITPLRGDELLGCRGRPA
jgi:hypothetical protein